MTLRQRKRQVLHQRAIIPRGMRCPECGGRGPHWVGAAGFFPGFWICNKFYGSDGRRLNPIDFDIF